MGQAIITATGVLIAAWATHGLRVPLTGQSAVFLLSEDEEVVAVRLTGQSIAVIGEEW